MRLWALEAIGRECDFFGYQMDVVRLAGGGESLWVPSRACGVYFSFERAKGRLQVKACED